MRSLASVFVVAALLAGCAGHPVNEQLVAQDLGAGYRYQNLSGEGNSDRLFVILAFSGGGTRAAAFSFGVMEALRDARYATSQGPRRLLDDVDVISSVSGGSFTAAYYALFRKTFFDRFPQVFLNQDIQRALVLRVLRPDSWFRLMSSSFDRINLAAEVYDETVFEGKRFADLVSEGRKPYVILNATDMALGRRFEFTQDQFDFLCSDLARLKVATAVAASSAFPGLLSPLTLRNYAEEQCGFQPPGWLANALVPEKNPPRRYTLARDLASYQDLRQHRAWIHLLDGGLADNIGLRGPYVALSSEDSGWSLYPRIDRGEVRRVMVISVNAKTKPRQDWDQRQAAPSLLSVLGFVSSGPMDNYSFDTVQLVRDFFAQQNAETDAFEQCTQRIKERCPAATSSGTLRRVDLHAVEISFDAVPDEKLRFCLDNLATSFSLPPATITLLRQVARWLVMNSPEFLAAMRALDPAWESSPVAIDAAARAEACHEGQP